MADTTTYTGLETAILDDGIRSKNFFNGRLLSAEDLRQEQEEERKVHWRLGEAIGYGVLYGFEVSINNNSNKVSPVVDIQAGLAVSRSGKILKATKSQSIALTAQGTSSVDGFASFTPCQPLLGGTYKAGPGLYVLTVTSAFGNTGRAQVSGLGNASLSCNTDNVVEGLQFRMLDLGSRLSAAPGDAKFRNLVAYEFFDTAISSKGTLTNPFDPPLSGSGVLDSLRGQGLSDCDVPLAFIFWSAGKGIEFVDMWAVRRGLTEHSYTTRPSIPFSARRLSESQAMCLQFQDQIEDMRTTETDLASLTVSQRFKFLPPIGLLPVIGPGSPTGFNPATFFGALAGRDVAMTDGELVRSLMNEALHHEPIDLSRPDKIQLYSMWENVKAVEQGQSKQRALVFATHALPYRGVARFGQAHWNLSRFTPAVI